MSSHLIPIHTYIQHPSIGRAEDKGEFNNTLNLPIKAYTAIDDFLPLFEEQALPFLKEWNPQLVIVSAGYDSMADDPLAQVNR